MSNITRRTFLKAAAVAAPAAAIMGFPFIAKAAQPEFHFKYGTNLQQEHPFSIWTQKTADAIKERTQGRVVIDVFPNNQLGGDTDMLAQVRRGGIDMFNPSSLVIATLVPVAAINAVGFAFADYDQVWETMDGPLGELVRKGFERVGLHAMDNMWDNGFRQMTSNTGPINSVADMKGLKIRVPVSPIIVDMFKGMGAAPVGMQYSEVYSSLQTKVIDAQENPLVVLKTGKLYEVQKYCSLTNHIWDGYWCIMNKKSWESLPPDLQEIVSTAFKEGAQNQRAEINRLNTVLVDDLKNTGLAFNNTVPESFRQKLKESGYYATWHKKFGDEAWALLENAVGKLS